MKNCSIPTQTTHRTDSRGQSSLSCPSRAACVPPTPAKELLAEFWRLEKEAEKMLEGLAG